MGLAVVVAENRGAETVPISVKLEGWGMLNGNKAGVGTPKALGRAAVREGSRGGVL